MIIFKAFFPDLKVNCGMKKIKVVEFSQYNKCIRPKL